jgi:cell division initiation protein
MDRILPIDLERAQLRKSAFGYRKRETDALIEGAARSMQQMLVENDHLRKELDLYRLEIGRLRAQEDTLKDTMLIAQRAADDTRAATQRSCDALVEEARMTAQQERQAAQTKLSELRWDIERMQAERKRFEDDFRLMLDRYRIGLEPDLIVLHGDAAGA